MSILIVDDSPSHCRLIEHILHKAGYFDTIAMDSATTLYTYMDKTPAPDIPAVDLILMDIMLPGVNGLDACRSITTDPRFGDIPVVMVTSMTDPESLQQAFAAGATDHLRKPILAVELVARICTLLTKRAEMTIRKRREHDLGVAMQELQALRGWAPICASGKRIRGPGGKWESLEEFVKTHSDLRVDDTLCQYCVEQWRQDQATA